MSKLQDYLQILLLKFLNGTFTRVLFTGILSKHSQLMEYLLLLNDSLYPYNVMVVLPWTIIFPFVSVIEPFSLRKHRVNFSASLIRLLPAV